MQKRTPTIFISYAREDLPSAKKLYERLKAERADPWLDKESLLGGENWRIAIKNAIARSRYFVALISSNSIGKRGFVQKEVRQAIEMLDEFPESEIFLIPARLDGSEPPFNRLKDIHCIDLFPDWDAGVSKLLLTLDMIGNCSCGSSEASAIHPRDKAFAPTAEWGQDGLAIVGGNISIKPSETKALFKSWLNHLPNFVVQEAPKSKSANETLEKAFLLAALRASHEVYEAVPDEEEMQRGSSILSRKLNLFYAFARDAYLKAEKRGMDLKDYVLGEVPKTRAGESDPDLAQRQSSLRSMLHHYVSRACDVNLDQVELFERLMRKFPPWEPLVEKTYDIDERKVLEMFHQVKMSAPKMSDAEIAGGVTAFIIDQQHGLEDIKLGEDKPGEDR
jgi:hypothetical protein